MTARLCIAKLVLVVAATGACERQHMERRGPAADAGKHVASAAKAAKAETKSVPIEIAALGQYLPHDDKAQDERNRAWWRSRHDDKWLALCIRAEVTELVPTRMQIASTEVDGDKNGLIVSSASCPDALVLIRGLPRTSGAIPTARVTHKATPSARAQDSVWEIVLSERSSRLHFEDAVGLPLMISTGTQTQEIRNWRDGAAQMAEPGSTRHDWGFASGVKILWAGDVNGDGALDLLLKQGDAEIGMSMELYLSSGGASAPRLILADRFDYGAC